MMGPNAMKLLEELAGIWQLGRPDLVLDLGCGMGLTSIFMAKEYGWNIIASDLWVDPTDNYKTFKNEGVLDRIIPIRAEAHELPYARESFDLVVSVDAYQYFGYEEGYLETHLLPLLKPGCSILIAVPGVKEELGNDLPAEMALSWTREDISTFHSIEWWKALLEGTEGLKALEVIEMKSFDVCWQEWLDCDNPHAIGDRPAMEGGAGKYMNFIAIRLVKE